MPTTDYAVHIKESAVGSVGVAVFRNPATVPVDGVGETVRSSRVSIPWLNGQATTPVKSIIVSATAATPIVATITTGEGANFASGDLVLVSNGLVDLNINGTFFITVAGDALTLVGSATDGTYTASSATVRKINKAGSFHIALAAAAAAVLNDKAAGF